MVLQASASSSAAAIQQVDFFVDGVGVGSVTTGASPFSLNFNTASPTACNGSPCSDGNHLFQASATDTLGNSAASSVITAKIDNSPPGPVTANEPSSTFITGTAASFEATAFDAVSGVTQVQIFQSGSFLGSASFLDFTGTHNYIVPVNTTALTEGPLSFEYRATNGSGLTASVFRNLTVDNTDPSLTHTAPTAGTYSGNVSYSATATDANGIARVEIWKDAFSTGSLLKSVTSGTSVFTSTLTPSDLPDGTYNIFSVAIDNAGRSTVGPAIAMVVDNSGPDNVVINSPTGGTVVGTTFNATATATDSSSSVTTVEYYLGSTLMATSNSSPTWPVTINTSSPLVAEGPQNLTILAYNIAGVSAPSAPVALIVDRSDPVVSYDSPPNGSNVAGTITLQASASDPQSGITQVFFEVDGSLLSTPATNVSSTTYESSFDTTTLADGSYSVRAQATNGGGTTVFSTPAATLNINNSSPAVTVTTPVGGSFMTGTFPLSATSAGAVLVDFLIDGAVVGTDTSSPFSINFDSTSGSFEGNRNLVARSQSAFGVTSNSPTVNFTIDNTPPVSVTRISPSTSLLTGTQLFQARSLDSLGIVKIEVFVGTTLLGTDTFTDTTGTHLYSISVDTSIPGDGTHSFEYRATNQVGLTQSVFQNFTVDNSAPIVSIVSPTPGSYTGSVAFTANATDSDSGIDRVEIWSGGFPTGSLLRTLTSATSVFSTTLDDTDLGDGNTTLEAVAFNTFGVSTASAPVAITYDSSGPIGVAVTNPTDGGVVGPTFLANASASDPHTGITNVEYQLNGIAVANSTAGTTFPVTIDTTTPALIPEGPAVLTVLATNGVGLTTTSPGINLTVDRSDPTVNYLAPANGANVSGTVTFQASADDPQSGISSVFFEVNGSLLSTPATNVSSTLYESTFDTTTLADGSYSARAQATNGAGVSVFTVPTATINVNNSSAAVTVTSPSAGAFLTGTFPISANSAGAILVDFLLDGSLIGTANSSPFTINFDSTSGAFEGNRNLVARSQSLFGVTSSSTPVNFTIDNTAPTSVTSLAPTTTLLSGTETFLARATDTLGVAQIEIFVGGTLLGTDVFTDTTGTHVYSISVDTTTVGDGTHSFEYRATNRVGLATSIFRNLTVDNSAPSVAILNPTSGTFTGSVAFTADATDADSGIDRVEVWRGGFPTGTQIRTLTSATNLFTATLNSGDLPDGNHGLEAVAFNTFGVSTVSNTVNITYDNSPPAVAVTSPTSGSAVGSFFTATATASDPHTTISTVVYSINGSPVGGTAIGPTYSVGIDTASPVAIPEGPAVLTVTAQNSAGLTTVSPGVAITIDRSLPVVTYTAPASGSNVLGTVILQGTASDPETGITTAQFEINGVLQPPATNIAGNIYTYDFDTTTFPDGPVTVRLRAVNSAGQPQFSTPAATLNIFNTNATVLITSPAAGFVTGTISYSATATDAVLTEFFVDGSTLLTDTTTPYTTLLDTTTLSEGNHTLSVEAENGAGVRTTAPVVSITVDNSAPDPVSITFPTTDALLTGTVLLQASAADSTAPVTSVEFFINGSQEALVTGAGPTYGHSFDTTSRADSANGYSLSAIARNQVGLSTTVGPVTFGIDNSPPSVTYNAPAPGSILGGNVTLSAFAADPQATVANPLTVEFVLDGVTVFGPAVDGGGVFTFDLDTTSQTDGPHTLIARATNAAGLTAETSPPVNLSFANGAPAVLITTPGAGAYLGTIPFEVSATSVVSVDFQVDGGTLATQSTTPFSIPLDTSILADGNHTLTAVGTNAGGGSTTSPAVVIVTDQSPPASVTFTQPTTNIISGTVTLQTTATDPHSGISSVSFTADGGTPIATVLPPTFVFNFDTTSLADGPHTLEATATNGTGLTLTTTFAVTVDNSVPLAAVTSPPAGAVRTGNFTVTADASDSNSAIQRVELYANGVYIRDMLGVEPSYFTTMIPSDVADGPVNLHVEAINSVGATTVSSNVAIVVDNSGPDSVAITSPATNAFVRGAFAVDVQASDSHSANSSVEFFVDGSSIGTATGPAPNYSITLDSITFVPALTDGPHTLTAVATNEVGLTGSATPVSVVIDNSPPTSTYVSPPDGTPVAGAVTLTATATDGDSGVTQVEFLVGGSAFGPAIQSGATSTYTFNLDSTLVPDGILPVQARATNGAGATTLSTPVVNLVIANGNPSVVITSPTTGTYQGTIPYNVIASSAVSVEFLVDGTAIGTDTASPFTTTLDTTLFGDGAHTLLARGTNGSGSTTDSAPVQIVIDNSPPAVALTNPSQPGTFTGVLSLFAVATDTASNIALVEFLVDGGVQASASSSPFTSDFDTSVLVDGNHNFQARATNAAGISSTSTPPLPVLIDNSAPALTVTTPAPGSVQGLFRVEAITSDTHTGIAQVQFFLDGLLRSQFTTGPFESVLDSTPLGQGFHSLEVRSTNGAGIATSAFVSVVVDNTGPSVSITNPLTGFLSGDVLFEAAAQDTVSGVTQVSFLADGSLPFGIDSTAPFSTTLQTTNLADGSHSFVATAVNGGGDSTDSPTVILTIDNSPPTGVALVQPSGLFLGGTAATLRGTAVEPHSGIQRMEYFVDGGLVGSSTTPPYAVTFDATTLSAGAHSVAVSVFNGAGLSATVSPIPTFILDPTAPTVTLNAPTGGAFTGNVTFDATASDPESGIAQVEWFASNLPTPVATDTLAPFNVTVDSSIIPDGADQTVFARATNGAGETFDTPDFTVTFDNSPPEASIDSPTNGFQSGTILFDFNVDEPHSSVTQVDFFADGVVQQTLTAAPFQVSFDSTILADGVHSFSIGAQNSLGLSINTTPIQLSIDNSVPVVTLTSPTNGSAVPDFFLAQASALDPHSGIQEIEFLVDGVVVSALTSAPFEDFVDTTILNEGLHTIAARATNGAGLVFQTADNSFLVDRSAPSVTVTAPTSSDFVSGVVTFQVDASDAESGIGFVEFLVNGDPVGTDPTPPYETTVDTQALGLGDGVEAFQARAVNGSGLESFSEIQLPFVDNSPPEASLTDPTAGPLTGSVQLTAFAEDTDSGIRDVEFLLDGVVLATDSTDPYEHLLDLTLVTDGMHDFQVRATNVAGLTTTTPSLLLDVDNSEPFVIITAPTAGPIRGAFSFLATAQDVDSGISQVEFFVDGSSVGVVTTSPYQVLVDPAVVTVPEGEATLEAVATNGVGLSLVTSITLTLDNQPPTVDLLFPGTDPLLGQVTLEAFAFDEASGVSQVDFLVDGSVVATATTTPHQVSYQTTLLSDGSHVFSARATDGVGFETTSTTVTTVVDNSGPSVSLTEPTTSATGTATVRATVSEPHSAIQEVEFFVDGDSVQYFTASPFEFLFDTTGITDGSHTFSVVATNTVGLSSQTSATILVDNSPADVELIQPDGASVRETLEVTMPTARSNLALVALDQSLLAIGGAGFGGLPTAAVEEYNPASKAWVVRNAMASPRVGPFAGRIGNKVYVAGGRVSLGGQTDTAEVYDISSATWTTGVSLTTARERGASVVTNGKLYAMGGLIGSTSASGIVEVYEPGQGWTTGVSMGVPRYDAAAVVYGRYIYVFGGNSGFGALTTVERFDLANRIWQPTTSMPVADSGMSAVVVGTKIYLTGGNSGSFLAFDPATLTWSVLGESPVNETSEGGGAVLGDSLYLAGGFFGPATQGTTWKVEFPAARVLSGVLSLEANASDPDTGIAAVAFQVDGSVVASDASSPYTGSFNTASVSDGSHLIEAVASNGGGQSSSQGANFLIENAAPTVSLSAPTGGVQTSTIEFEATATTPTSRITQVEFLVDGAVVGVDNSEPFGIRFDASALPDGNHNFQARATNAGGKTATSIDFFLPVDKSGAAVFVVQPRPPTIATGTVTFEATATDSQSGVEEVEFFVGGFSVGSDLVSPYSITVDTTGFDDGPQEFVAQASNFAGLISTSTSNIVTIDNSPPTVALTSPVGSAGAIVSLAATADDPHSGIQSVVFQVDGSTVATVNTPPFTASYDSLNAGLSDGTHLFEAIATNGAGLQTASGPVSIILDNSPPTVSQTAPTTGPLTGSIFLSADASDAQSPIATVAFLVDGTVVGTDSAAPYTIVFDTSTLTDGLHFFQVTATNAGGQSASSSSLSALVDNSLPTVSLTSPTGGVVRNTVTLTATADDVQTGIASVAFLVDGSVVGSTTQAPFSFSLDTSPFSNGVHTLQAQATNGVGQTQLSAAVSVTVDNAGSVDLTPGSDGEGGVGSDLTPDNSVAADGVSPALKIVTLRDNAGRPVSSVTVTLLSDRASDVVTPASAVSDSNGQAIFSVRSSVVGLSTFRAFANGQLLTDTATTNFLNSPPISDAGADRTVQPGNVVLDGSASRDPNGNFLTYSWAQLSGTAATIVNPTLVQTPVLLTQAGSYTFQLTVFDGSGGSAADTVTLTVSNVAPVARAGDDFEVSVGTPASLDGSRSGDGNGDSLTYVWNEVVGNPVTGTISGVNLQKPTLNFTTAGVYQYELSVNDGTQNSLAKDSVTVVVHASNRVVPNADAGIDQVARVGETVTLTGHESVDPDDGQITGYSWSESVDNPARGILSSATAQKPTFQPPLPGRYVFSLRVSDIDGLTSKPDEVEVVVQPTSGGTVPLACYTASTSVVRVGTTVLLDASCSEDGSSTLSYRWDLVAPVEEAQVSSSAVFSYTPVLAGVHQIKLTVNSNGLATTRWIDLSVSPAAGNPPVVDPGFVDSAGSMSTNGQGRSFVGRTVTLMAGAFDPDGDSLEYLWEKIQGPSTLLSDARAQNPTFVPLATRTYHFRCHVSDGTALVSKDVFVVVDGPGNSVPTSSAEAPTNATVGSFTMLNGINSFDPDGQALIHIWIQISGPRVTLTAANSATPSFVPPVPGTYVFEHYVDDGADRSLPGRVSVTVSAATGGGTSGTGTGGTGGGTSDDPGFPVGGGGGGGGGCRSAPDGGGSIPMVLLTLLLLLPLRRPREAWHPR